MELLPFNRCGSVSEYDMQNALVKVIRNREYWDSNYSQMYHSAFTEVTIPGIGRRSDIIIKMGGSKLINIECKLIHYSSVLEQAVDHLRWCDYSYICLHSTAFVPNYIVHKIIKDGVGLIYWTGEAFIEVLHAYYNSYKKGFKDKEIREKVDRIIQQKSSEQAGNKVKQLEW